MINLEKILKEKIVKMENQIRKAAQERDESATPTESTHDQTRQIANQLFNSLLEEKHELMILATKIKKYKTIYKVEKLESETKMNYYIVPDGLGGIMIEDTLLVGESSPIGKILSTKDDKEEYQFNNVTYRILHISENV